MSINIKILRWVVPKDSECEHTPDGVQLIPTTQPELNGKYARLACKNPTTGEPACWCYACGHSFMYLCYDPKRTLPSFWACEACHRSAGDDLVRYVIRGEEAVRVIARFKYVAGAVNNFREEEVNSLGEEAFSSRGAVPKAAIAGMNAVYQGVMNNLGQPAPPRPGGGVNFPEDP